MLETAHTLAPIRGKSKGTTNRASVNKRLEKWDKKMIQPVAAEIHPVLLFEKIGLLSVSGALGVNHFSHFSSWLLRINMLNLHIKMLPRKPFCGFYSHFYAE